MSISHRQHRRIPLNAGPGTLSPAVQTVTALYTIERETGFSVQASLLTVWIAATTYLTAAIGILALLLGSDSGKALSDSTKVILMGILPLPACALAGYHLIIFGIGLIHSRSIELLERELVNEATQTVKVAYDRAGIGSKSETKWTNFRNASLGMLITSAVAFVVPYLSALIVTAFCLYRIYSTNNSIPWPWWPLVAFYGTVLGTLVCFGGATLYRGPRPSR